MGHLVTKLPTGPINSGDVGRILKANNDVLNRLQRDYADNFALPRRFRAPSQPAVVKITASSVNGVTLGTGWYSGMLQIPLAPCDPAVAVNFANLYQNKDVNDDCYVLAPPSGSSGSTSSTISTGTCYLGEILSYAQPSNSNLPSRLIVMLTGSPSSSSSIGQYQYQTYQMTAQNVAGWDFTRAHPLL